MSLLEQSYYSLIQVTIITQLGITISCLLIGPNKVLDYTYHINRIIFQNYTINGNTINDCKLEFVLKKIQVTSTHYKGYIMLTHTLEVLQNYNKYF